MKLKLVSPHSSLYWTIVAEELEDPSNWSVFLLNHGPETDRYQFEQAAQQASPDGKIVLTPYRLKCRRGMCTLEYGDEADRTAVMAHARRVADLLSTPLDMTEVQLAPRRTG
jgi:hypothetical protein